LILIEKVGNVSPGSLGKRNCSNIFAKHVASCTFRDSLKVKCPLKGFGKGTPFVEKCFEVIVKSRCDH